MDGFMKDIDVISFLDEVGNCFAPFPNFSIFLPPYDTWVLQNRHSSCI